MRGKRHQRRPRAFAVKIPFQQKENVNRGRTGTRPDRRERAQFHLDEDQRVKRVKATVGEFSMLIHQTPF